MINNRKESDKKNASDDPPFFGMTQKLRFVGDKRPVAAKIFVKVA